MGRWRAGSLLGVASVVLAFGAVSAAAKPKGTDGWLAGAIHIVGGPHDPEYQDAPHEGWVHVQTPGGNEVMVRHVPRGKDFKIKIPKGRYEVFAGTRSATSPELDCTGEKVTIQPGQQSEVTLDVGCGIP